MTTRLMDELYDDVQEGGMRESRYVTLTALALQLHNALPGIVGETRREAILHPPSESSYTAELRARAGGISPPPMEVPPAMAARIAARQSRSTAAA